MTARQTMTHRALIERYTAGAADDSGNPSPGVWATAVASQPCRLYSTTSREAISEDRTAVVVDLKIMLPLDADVTEDDRINGITDRNGGTILDGLAAFAGELLHKGDHREASLTRVTS